jgi:DNA-binding CsgD family transcriptional regulator
MNERDALLGLIQLLYAAPGTRDGWHAFLDSLRVTLHGSVANLICHNMPSHTGSFVATTMAPDLAAAYQQHWCTLDPWARSPKQRQLGQRPVTVGDDLISHTELKRTAFYQDFARLGDAARVIGGVAEPEPQSMSVLSVNRGERIQPFAERDVAFLEALVPHVGRALQLHRRLLISESASADFADVLDRAPRAVLLIGSQGKVMFMNRAASRLCALRDGLTVEHGELRAVRSGDTTRLPSLLEESLKTSTGNGTDAGGVLRVGRPSGRRSFHVLVCAVSRRPPTFPTAPEATAVVYVTDPEQVAVVDELTLCALFGLTPAEARLARLLVQGASLAAAERDLGLRRETVRTRLKTIFEKTNTHRQSELVTLILNATPSI